MARSLSLIACALVCQACAGETSSTSDAADSGSTAQDDGGSGDAGALRDGGTTSQDGGSTGTIIRVLNAGTPIGARVDLGEIGENETATPLVLELENGGSDAFEVGSIELVGGDTNAFILTPAAMSTIPAGARTTFSVALHPPAIGDFLSRVEVRGTIGATRVAAFEVFGHGTMVVVGARKLFVAVGMSVRRVISEDGMTWTDSQSENQPMGDNDYQFRGACYGNGIYVGVGGAMLGRIFWTRDGTHWTNVSDDQNFIGGCAYGNGYFVAVGSSGRHLRSVDGNTWTDAAHFNFVNFRSIAFGAGKFVAVGDQGRRAVTEDGVDWTATSTGGDQLWSVGFGVDRFVAVGANGRTVTSTDTGTTWLHDQSTGTLLRGVAYGNSTWVAVGQNTSLTSPDGINWTPHTVMGAAFSGITFGDGKFIGVGYPNRRLVSTDGVSWGQPISDADPALIAVAFGSGQ